MRIFKFAIRSIRPKAVYECTTLSATNMKPYKSVVKPIGVKLTPSRSFCNKFRMDLNRSDVIVSRKKTIKIK